MTDLADDKPAARGGRPPSVLQFRELTPEEHAAEARIAAGQGRVLAGGRCWDANAFRWVLWADAPLSPEETAAAFRNWKRHGFAPAGRVVSIFGPWATRRLEPRWKVRMRKARA